MRTVMLLVMLCAAAVPLHAQSVPVPLFSDTVAARDAASAMSRASRLDAPIVQRRIAGMHIERLFNERTAALALDLFDTTLVATRERIDHDASGHRSWVGRVDGDLDSNVVFTERDGIVAGLVTTRDATYQVRTVEPGLHAIEQVNISQLPRESEPLLPPPGMRAFEAVHPAGAADSGAEIDVLFLYTPETVSRAGGASRVQALISQVITNTNNAYSRSGIATRVRLVGSSALSYTEHPSNMSSDLQWVAASPAAQALRNQAGADLVQLLVHSDAPSCGVGYLMTSPSSGFESAAYSIADWRCASQYTPTREMGHNQGARHAPEDGASGAIYPYSYGYKSPASGFRTIMAYNCSGTNCPRALNLSNPGVTHNGAVTGTSIQNNALSINNTATTIANFRQAVVTTTVTAPSAPTGLAAAVNGTQVTVFWNAVSNDPPPVAYSPASSYLLQVGSATGAANLFSGNVGNVTSATGAVAPGTYFWRVFAVNAAGMSPASQEAQFTVGAGPGACTAPPSAPQNFTHSVLGSAVTLAWQAPASGTATSYSVEAGSAPALANLYNAAVGNVLGVSVGAPRGTYFVRVRASNACGTSAPSNERTVVVP